MAAETPRTKCARVDCDYLVHSDAKHTHGYCCHCCKLDKGHGPQCEHDSYTKRNWDKKVCKRARSWSYEEEEEQEGETVCTAEALNVLSLSSLHRPRPRVQPIVHAYAAACTEASEGKDFNTVFEVTGEDTLECAVRLTAASEDFQPGAKTKRPLVLNMANPHRCGGGFLCGCEGQEESLCRRTTLFFELHDAQQLGLYPLDERAVVCSDVVVFPDATRSALTSAFPIAVITASAPYKPDLSTESLKCAYAQTMLQRVTGLLHICAQSGYTRLVLSAWGCGAFKNPAEEVACSFRKAFRSTSLSKAFEHVVFAIVDRPMPWGFEENRAPFEKHFADLLRKS